MKHRMSLLALGISLGISQAWALAITIDGNLADWGINPTNWLPSDPHIHYKIEDQTGGGGAFLYPGWGGQAYDAEAMYALIQGNRLYVALATGHNPRTLHKPSANTYGAGDFFLDFGKDGDYEVAININHRLPTAFESDFLEGGAYKVHDHAWGLWNETDPEYPLSPARRPTYLTVGDYLGLVDLAYTTTPVTGWGASPGDQHYFYEWSVDLDMLRNAGWDGSAFNIHWTMNCANDTIWLEAPNAIPAPSTLALLPLGLLGLAALRRYRPG